MPTLEKGFGKDWSGIAERWEIVPLRTYLSGLDPQPPKMPIADTLVRRQPCMNTTGPRAL